MAIVSGVFRAESSRSSRPPLADELTAIVAADDVERGKPHPEGSLLALERLGVDAAAASPWRTRRPASPPPRTRPRCIAVREPCRTTGSSRPTRSSTASTLTSSGSSSARILAIDQGTTGTTLPRRRRRPATVGRGYARSLSSSPSPGGSSTTRGDLVERADDGRGGARSAVSRPRSRRGRITNQRETTVVWERRSGRPVHNAIVWQDRRTASRCAELPAALVRERTGLVCDPYFSATKLESIVPNASSPCGSSVRRGSTRASSPRSRGHTRARSAPGRGRPVAPRNEQPSAGPARRSRGAPGARSALPDDRRLALIRDPDRAELPAPIPASASAASAVRRRSTRSRRDRAPPSPARESAARSPGSRDRPAEPIVDDEAGGPVVPWSMARIIGSPTSRRIRARSIRSTSSSAAASRSSGSVPRTARQRSPAAFAAATPASVSSNATASPGPIRAARAPAGTPRGPASPARRRRPRRSCDVAGDAGGLDDRLDLGPERARDDRHRNPRRRVADASRIGSVTVLPSPPPPHIARPARSRARRGAARRRRASCR